jgi:four helix bundle protein
MTKWFRGGELVSRQEQLRDRTKAFAVRIVRLFQALPYRSAAYVLGKQLLRSGTAVAANYRAACRARSKAEWIAKIGIVVEEADETVFWLEMLAECEIVPRTRLEALLNEAHELTALFTSSQRTSRLQR